MYEFQENIAQVEAFLATAADAEPFTPQMLKDIMTNQHQSVVTVCHCCFLVCLACLGQWVPQRNQGKRGEIFF